MIRYSPFKEKTKVFELGNMDGCILSFYAPYISQTYNDGAGVLAVLPDFSPTKNNGTAVVLTNGAPRVRFDGYGEQKKKVRFGGDTSGYFTFDEITNARSFIWIGVEHDPVQNGALNAPIFGGSVRGPNNSCIFNASDSWSSKSIRVNGQVVDPLITIVPHSLSIITGVSDIDKTITNLSKTGAGTIFDGEILLFKVWTRELSEAEILAEINYWGNRLDIDVSESWLPVPYPSQPALDYVALGFGAMICWSMPTFVQADYAGGNIDINTFAPTDYDIDNWLDAINAAGMKYAILIAKHHEGLALWPTEYHVPGYAPYSIAETTWYANSGQHDVVGEFVAGCRSRNIKPVIYMTVYDLTYEIRSGTTEVTDAPGYLAMIKTQLAELLLNYGEIFAIWFDGWQWHMPLTRIGGVPYDDVFEYIKLISPNTLIINNDQQHGGSRWKNWSEIETYEVAHPDANNVWLAEDLKPIRKDATWFYNDTKDQTATALFTKQEILDMITYANNAGSTFTLDITPDKSGHLPAAQKSILESLQV